jgi:hypothetical protein
MFFSSSSFCLLFSNTTSISVFVNAQVAPNHLRATHMTRTSTSASGLVWGTNFCCRCCW